MIILDFFTFGIIGFVLNKKLESTENIDRITSLVYKTIMTTIDDSSN